MARSLPLVSPLVSTSLIALGFLAGPSLCAVEIQGRLEGGFSASDGEASWVDGGLGKSSHGGEDHTGRLLLRADAFLFADISAAAVVEADAGRDILIGVQEAWLGFSPVPEGPWRMRAKAGAFFPASSLEVGYEGIGWVPEKTLSASAINSWISEEIRILGMELSLLRPGVFVGSAHTFGATVGVFEGNDPAGTLLAWRGWALGRRVTTLSEGLLLPDLPVYRPDGAIAAQTRDIHVFREIDKRPGLYGNLRYGHSSTFEAEALHYDNRADPLQLKSGQYSWHTRFDHVSVRARPYGRLELLAQAMRGDSVMGPNAVNIDFASWYLLASHPLEAGSLAVRYERFWTRDRDTTPDDPNDEKGRAWTLAYRYPLREFLSIVTEALIIDSDRPARMLIGEQARQIERSLTVEVHWIF